MSRKKITLLLSEDEETEKEDDLVALLIAKKKKRKAEEEPKESSISEIKEEAAEVWAPVTKKRKTSTKKPEKIVGYDFDVFPDHLPPKPLFHVILNSKTGQLL